MSLETRAFSWRAQRRRAAALELSSDLAGWLFAFVCAAAAADQLFALPRAVRAAAWALASAAAAWRARRSLSRAPWDALFADAARAWPSTRPLLASAWALRGEPGGLGVSAELRRAHLERADAAAAALPDEPLYAWTPSRAAKAGAAAAALSLAAALAAGARGAAFTRVLAPWRDAPLDRLVALLPGDATVDWGLPCPSRRA
ncbi:MAG: hypothetical protein M0D55_14445 [Elusimicrobiota bacterium]|nr:MAG: hypothetical protein M0D55_14445 [Elusimicrobiota bacterium]